MYILKASIIERKEIAEKTVEVSLKLDEKQFDFRAGQYLRLTIPELKYPDPRGNYRDFSIASSPKNSKILQVAMRKSESGFKRTLLEVPLGTEMQVTGPHGEFTLSADQKRPVVYIAGGIGITPFMSHLRFAAEEKLDYEFILFYGNRNKESAPYLSEFETLATQLPHFTVKNIFGPIGESHIREQIMSVMEITAPFWYLSGPPAMLDTFKKTLIALGVSEMNIHTEMFFGYEPGLSVESRAVSRRVETREDILKLQLARAETLLSALSDIALVSEDDLEGTITFSNDKFVEISKYSREELMGQNHRILKSGDYPRSFYKEIWKTISSGLVWHGEIKNKAKDGSFYWVDSVIAPVLGADGRPVSYISTRFPITDRKRLEEVTAKEQAILAAIGDGFYTVDIDSNILSMNKTAGELIGISPSECIGKKCYEVFNVKNEKGENISIKDRPVQIVLATGKKVSTSTTTTTYYYVRRDGTQFPVAITATPVILNNQIIGAIDIFRDITKEKEIEKLRTDFLSLASHQLRTPLSGTKWLIETMRRGVVGKVTAKQNEYLAQIYQLNERMIKLVFDMLNVLRMEGTVPEVKKKTFSTDEIFKDLMLRSETAAEARQVAILCPTDGKKIYLKTDLEALKSILECFLSNAINYSHSGQDVVLDIKEEPEAFIFFVKDQGIGIPKDEQKRIFERFYRAANAKNLKPDGTGLGLYIASMLAERIGAKASFESEENKGSIFYLRISKKLTV